MSRDGDAPSTGMLGRRPADAGAVGPAAAAVNQLNPSSPNGWQPGTPAPDRAPLQTGLTHGLPDPGGVGDLLAVVRRSRIGLAIWIATCLAIALIYLWRAPSEYVAAAQVVLEARRPMGASDSQTTAIGPTLDSAQADSQIEVIRSERNLRFVFDLLDLGNSSLYGRPAGGGVLSWLSSLVSHPTDEAPSAAAAELQRAQAFQAFGDRVGVRRIGQSYVLEISFRATDPAEAARLANAVTAAYIRDQVAYRAASLQRGTEYLEGRIAGLKAELDAATGAVKSGTIPAIQFVDADARIVSAALEPLGRSYPQTRLILVAAVIFGLATGIGVVACLHGLDRRVRSRQQIEHALGVPCLAVIPRLRPKIGRVPAASLTAALDAPDSVIARTLRPLRAALFSASGTARRSAVGVVSCSPEEGRSTVAANLAFLLATSGEPVLLIDADLREPSLTARLAPDAAAGLSDMLMHRADTGRLPAVQLEAGLVFTPAVAGGSTADSSAFLGSTDMQRALTRERAARNIVMDLAPLDISADVQAIGHVLDGVVLVIEADRTTLDEVSEAVRSLRLADVRLIGTVLNKATA